MGFSFHVSLEGSTGPLLFPLPPFHVRLSQGEDTLFCQRSRELESKEVKRGSWWTLPGAPSPPGGLRLSDRSRFRQAPALPRRQAQGQPHSELPAEPLTFPLQQRPFQLPAPSSRGHSCDLVTRFPSSLCRHLTASLTCWLGRGVTLSTPGIPATCTPLHSSPPTTSTCHSVTIPLATGVSLCVSGGPHIRLSTAPWSQGQKGQGLLWRGFCCRGWGLKQGPDSGPQRYEPWTREALQESGLTQRREPGTGRGGPRGDLGHQGVTGAWAGLVRSTGDCRGWG